jgi:hypothetical protein
MVRASPNKNDFSSGELASVLEGRQDIDRYAGGCRILENFLPLIVGGAQRRPGTNFVASTRYPDKLAVLLPFQYSTEQAYMLEFGDLYVRFYRNDGPLVETAKNITGATQANPVVLTITGHGYNNGDDIEVTGVAGMVQLNGRRFRVAGKTTNTVQLVDQHNPANNIDGTGYSAYTSGGTASRVYTLTTTYQEGDLTGLKIAQSVDTLYITHQEYVPRKLQRYGATNWLLSQIDFLDGPYLPINTSQATLSPSATTGAGITVSCAVSKSATGMASNGSGQIRVTCSGHGFKTGDRVDITGTVGTTEANNATDAPWTVTRVSASTFDLNGSVFANAWVSGGTIKPHIYDTTDVGRLIRLQHSSTWGWGKIVTVSSAVSATVDIFQDFGATTATANWRTGLYSQGGGYPTCVAIYEGRLFLGGCPLTPTRIDGSIAQDSAGINYETFSPTRTDGSVTDAEALQYPLDSGDVNNVLWMKDDEKGLLVGTLGGEWLVRSNALGDALTPTNVKAVRGTTYGSYANSQPVRTGSDVIYVQRKQRKVRNLNYTYTTDGFQAGDLSLLSPHITINGVGQLAYQAEPQGWVWGVRGDGQAVVIGYDRGENKIGWGRVILGGFQDAARLRPAAMESAASIPSPDDARDEVWMIVRRTINGKTERYIEYLSGQWEEGDDQEQADFLDCSLKFNGAQNVTLTPGAGADAKGTTGVTFTAGASVFISSDVGRLITVRYFDYSETDPENPAQLGKWKTARAKITAYTSATVVTASILSPFQSTDMIATMGWRLSAEALSNLWHLEGETIRVNAEGATHPDRTVTNGTIQLTRGVGYAVAGLKCAARLQTLRIEAGAADGTSQGKIKRINEVVVRSVQSLGTQVGPDFSNMEPISYRTSATPLGQPPEIADGDSEPIKWQNGYETDGRMSILNDSPFPCTVVALLPQVVTQDKG